MKAQIDLKSTLFGLMLGVVAMLAIGAETNSNEIGRYQIACGSGFGLMLDTKTGQAWTCAVGTLNRNDSAFFLPKSQ